MHLHPAPPHDRDGLIDALDHALQDVIDLGWSCSDADFDRVTECLDWTVKDQISHVVGGEKAVAGTAGEPGEAAHAEADVDFAARSRLDVQSRRDLPGADVVAELANYKPERINDLRDSEATLDTVVGGAHGPDTTFAQLLSMRIVDVWCHGQDIRAALNRPGNLDSPAAAVFTTFVLSALPRIAARKALVEVGHAVVIDVTGPVQARAGVRLVHGEDGRPYSESLWSGHDRPVGEQQFDVTTIHLTTDALSRRASGRRGVDAIHYTVTGDEDTARRVLEELVVPW